MAKELRWENDPIVRLEGLILPVCSAAPEIVARLLLRMDHSPGSDARITELLQCFAPAEAALRNAGKKFLEPANIKIEGPDWQHCQSAADAVGSVGHQLREAVGLAGGGQDLTAETGAQLIRGISSEMLPGIETALNVLRRVFIGTVLNRQTAQARQAEAAISQLTEISETIFFIAVNASVEAARAGDQGRGFAVIGQDIRSLALNARNATTRMRSLMSG